MICTFNYEFEPGDTAFTVAEDACMDEVLVLQLTFVSFLTENGDIGERACYLVKKKVDDTTIKVTPDRIIPPPPSFDALNTVFMEWKR